MGTAGTLRPNQSGCGSQAEAGPKTSVPSCQIHRARICMPQNPYSCGDHYLQVREKVSPRDARLFGAACRRTTVNPRRQLPAIPEYDDPEPPQIRAGMDEPEPRLASRNPGSLNTPVQTESTKETKPPEYKYFAARVYSYDNTSVVANYIPLSTYPMTTEILKNQTGAYSLLGIL